MLKNVILTRADENRVNQVRQQVAEQGTDVIHGCNVLECRDQAWDCTQVAIGPVGRRAIPH